MSFECKTYIVCCGIKEKNEEQIIVFALCIPCSHIHGSPHEITVTLTTENIMVKCTCKGGLSGYCKHGIATLLYINRMSLADMDDLSSTDLIQEWGKEKGNKYLYEVKPLERFCHVKPAIIPTVLDEMLKLFKQQIGEVAPNSAIGQHSKGRTNVCLGNVHEKNETVANN